MSFFGEVLTTLMKCISRDEGYAIL
jgi:hypothetical protein